MTLPNFKKPDTISGSAKWEAEITVECGYSVSLWKRHQNRLCSETFEIAVEGITDLDSFFTQLPEVHEAVYIQPFRHVRRASKPTARGDVPCDAVLTLAGEEPTHLFEEVRMFGRFPDGWREFASVEEMEQFGLPTGG